MKVEEKLGKVFRFTVEKHTLVRKSKSITKWLVWQWVRTLLVHSHIHQFIFCMHHTCFWAERCSRSWDLNWVMTLFTTLQRASSGLLNSYCWCYERKSIRFQFISCHHRTVPVANALNMVSCAVFTSTYFPVNCLFVFFVRVTQTSRQCKWPSRSGVNSAVVHVSSYLFAFYYSLIFLVFHLCLGLQHD